MNTSIFVKTNNMNAYNLRPRKMINYDENAYFDKMGIEEIQKSETTKSFIKIELMANIKNALKSVEIAPQVHKPYFVMKAFEWSILFIREFENHPKFKIVLMNKINEMKNEKQMSKYKAKLNKYYNELDSMMDIDCDC